MTPHTLESTFVRDQFALRALPLNEKRLQPDGEYILYWMQSTHRFEDNWALRFATFEADRIGKPLLIHHGLDPHYTYASPRFHTFIMEGARELAARAVALGLTYRFALRRRRADDGRVVDRLASRACLVITDLFPSAGIAERSARLAARVNCRVVAVDSVAVVAAGSFPREEYAARTIRPKIARLLDHSIQPVQDRAPRRALAASLLGTLGVEWLDVAACDIAAEVAACEIDHAVGVVETRGGLDAARARLHAFASDGLLDYAARRRNPSDPGGSSHLSGHLHFGMISPLEIVHTVRAAATREQSDAFLNEMLTWRELSFNFCLRNEHYDSLAALPDWVHRTMREHAQDARPVTYTLEQLERAETHDDLWNAGQRELVTTGQMHNVVRMLWGKSVLTWAPSHEHALAWLIHLNNKYGLDGRDPNSFGGIQWCFGKFDRPFANRSVWGTIRPMSLERARKKYELAGYLEQFGAAV